MLITVKHGLLFGETRCKCFLSDGDYHADLLILLDLNGTLAKKFSSDYRNGKVSYAPEHDEYCPVLTAELADPNLFVVIVTARAVDYREQTISQLRAQFPDLLIRGYIAREGSDRREYSKIWQFKPLIFKALLPHVGLENMLMLESNTQTHVAYVQAGGKYIINRKEFAEAGAQWTVSRHLPIPKTRRDDSVRRKNHFIFGKDTGASATELLSVQEESIYGGRNPAQGAKAAGLDAYR